MAETLHFKVSSGLKNIIGRELINDKYIAIFELVKNSYDAGAKQVTIRLDDLGTDAAAITITDDGKGMNKDDIINKWLFVAYSEKRNPTYRDSIKRAVAGAKGVGRFSCDRLGEVVTLSSKTRKERVTHEICISWADFEKNSLDNFADIDVQYNSVDNCSEDSGTKIVIRKLRESWSRSDLLALKKSLTQLVNPTATNSYDVFSISLCVPTEIDADKNASEERDRVNGEVKNTIFDVINQKTTKITVEISENGKDLTTVLNDRGTFLFKTVEKSEFTLRNISCTLYFLNRSAKLNFTRKMGVDSVNYGSIFVYKNGFRVYPYGEPGKDFFDIDQRKGQGFRRFLGTRDVIGQLDIYGDANDLNETSSRNNGFIATPHLEELQRFFLEYVLKPLEKYVINIVAWGQTDDFLASDISKLNFESVAQIVKKIKTRSKDTSYISIDWNEELAEHIIRKKVDVDSPVKQLEQLAVATQDDKLIKKAGEVVRQTRDLQKQVQQAAMEAEQAQEKLEQKSEELAVAQRQIGLLSARADLTAQDAIDAMHIMKGYADTIDSHIIEIYEEAEDSDIDISALRQLLDSISQVCKKIMNSYNLVMQTGYTANSDETHDDLVVFVQDYCSKFNRSMKVVVENIHEIVASVRFNPLEFSIILDNLIDNSRKAHAETLTLSFERDENGVMLRCRDDGYGLKQGANIGKLFEPGYTTTGGSGIGLSTVKKYIEKSGGKATYNPEYKSGFEVVLQLKSWI